MPLLLVLRRPCQPSCDGGTTSLCHIAPTIKLNMPHLWAFSFVAESLVPLYNTTTMHVMLTSLSGKSMHLMPVG